MNGVDGLKYGLLLLGVGGSVRWLVVGTFSSDTDVGVQQPGWPLIASFFLTNVCVSWCLVSSFL